MIRPILSYALTSLILISQVGVPLHMHYCKGGLESISLFVSTACEHQDILIKLPPCCKSELAKHCDKKSEKKCCDDEVVVLKQNITSIAPSFVKWMDPTVNKAFTSIEQFVQNISSLPFMVAGNVSDSDPPIYILHQALIFYA
ncbi:MAG: hypothetical protein ABIQ02_01465 [Saprospiraceae bacterium]